MNSHSEPSVYKHLRSPMLDGQLDPILSSCRLGMWDLNRRAVRASIPRQCRNLLLAWAAGAVWLAAAAAPQAVENREHPDQARVTIVPRTHRRQTASECD